MVFNGLCTISELSAALGEGRKNIERYVKAYREKGIGHFFNRKERRGQCYKMTEEKLAINSRGTKRRSKHLSHIEQSGD
jgi:transposase